MKIPPLILGLILNCLFFSCLEHAEKPRTWKSKQYDVSINYADPWAKIVPEMDSNEKLLVSFFNDLNGSGISISIEPDPGMDIVTDEMYGDALIEDILSSHQNNKFLAKPHLVDFHGNKYKMYSFEIHTGKWGPRTENFYIRRNGTEFIKVVEMYQNEKLIIDELLEFHKNIRLLEN